MSNNIWVLGELKGAEISRSTRECLTLAKSLGGTVTCVLLGSQAAGAANQAAAQGADKVAVCGDGNLDKWNLDNVVETVGAALKGASPGANLVITGATTHGKELIGRLAARFGGPLAAEALSGTSVGNGFAFVRPMYGGKVRATVSLTGSINFVSLRPNVLDVAATDDSKQASVEQIGFVAGGGKVELLAVETKADSGAVDLSEASRVVAGGRGLKGPENFNLIDDLAGALGAAVGASRMVVDAGWKEHRYQVGQTGKVVTPSLYVAVGISGAIQHLVGMQNSGCIVAINNNNDAPIFKIADYGVQADLFEFLPLLTAELKKG